MYYLIILSYFKFPVYRVDHFSSIFIRESNNLFNELQNLSRKLWLILNPNLATFYITLLYIGSVPKLSLNVKDNKWKWANIFIRCVSQVNVRKTWTMLNLIVLADTADKKSTRPVNLDGHSTIVFDSIFTKQRIQFWFQLQFFP